jgi:hypothetical protein
MSDLSNQNHDKSTFKSTDLCCSVILPLDVTSFSIFSLGLSSMSYFSCSETI